MALRITRNRRGWASALLAALLICVVALQASADEPASTALAASPEGLEFFEAHIRPLFVAHCLECHGEDKQGGLQLDSRTAMLAGSDNGPSIVPGNPAESRLLVAVRYDTDTKMPPEGKLSDEEIARLEAWIQMGAPAPTSEAPVTPPSDRAALAQTHWAFQPVVKPALPAVQQSDWPRSPIDNFILARLEAKGLKPSPPADRRTILRRASFDVTGLPPDSSTVQRLETDADPNALDRA